MRCLKCLYQFKDRKYQKDNELKVNKYLIQIANWGICNKCLDITVKEAADCIHNYYIANKDRYAQLHKGYKSKLTDSYVANALVDRTELKAKDMPKEMIEAKKQYMKLNRIVKEKRDAKN